MLHDAKAFLSPAMATSSGRDSLDQLYSIMQSQEVRSTEVRLAFGPSSSRPHAQNKLGGGEGVEGIYGSITKKGMQKIWSKLSHSCGFDHHSILVDSGAGLGR